MSRGGFDARGHLNALPAFPQVLFLISFLTLFCTGWAKLSESLYLLMPLQGSQTSSVALKTSVLPTFSPKTTRNTHVFEHIWLVTCSSGYNACHGSGLCLRCFQGSFNTWDFAMCWMLLLVGNWTFFLLIYLLAVQHGIWDLSSQFVVQSLSRV